ncbi:formyl-CoA transferase, partial [Salmonella enterica]|nr:formyl-CoA transferase [Salmonella enterica]
EEWTISRTKFEAMDILNQYNIPCAPVLSMKEIAEDESLRISGTIVDVEHSLRGRYTTVGMPIKMSDNLVEITASPLQGEHTDEILYSLGYDDKDIITFRNQKVI